MGIWFKHSIGKHSDFCLRVCEGLDFSLHSLIAFCICLTVDGINPALP